MLLGTTNHPNKMTCHGAKPAAEGLPGALSKAAPLLVLLLMPLVIPPAAAVRNMVMAKPPTAAAAMGGMPGADAPTAMGGMPGATPPAPAKPLRLFVDELYAPPVVTGDSQGNVALSAFLVKQKFHRDLPPTWVYAFGSSQETAATPGPTIVADVGAPLQVTWGNSMPGTQHILQSVLDEFAYIPRAEPAGKGLPLTVHLHGGVVSSSSDGHYESWYTMDGDTGPTFSSKTNQYPNTQAAGTLWYHDHTKGYTRLNAYAGLAGLYIIRNTSQEAQLNLPSGAQDIGLAIQDKSFDLASGNLTYPLGGAMASMGSMASDRLPEFFGDYNVVNGRVSPYANVGRALYRLRLLNGANARFYNLQFTAGGAPLAFSQIASDLGFLSAPVPMTSLLLAPGERAEVLLDFSQVPAGSSVLLQNLGFDSNPSSTPTDLSGMGGSDSAPSMGGSNGAPSSSSSMGGMGGSNGTSSSAMGGMGGGNGSMASPAPPPAQLTQAQQMVMKFIVGQQGVVASKAANGGMGMGMGLGMNTSSVPSSLVEVVQLSPSDASTERFIRLEIANGTANGTDYLPIWLEGLPATAPTTVKPELGTTEMWHYINVAGDWHPMHVHLFPHQLVRRQMFDVERYTAGKCTLGEPKDSGLNLPSCLMGQPLMASGAEVAWKDTTPAPPGWVTTVIVKWESLEFPSLPFDPTQGPGYVFHCHILDHEDYDMLRPFEMVAAGETQGQQSKGAGRVGAPIMLVAGLLGFVALFF